MVIFWLYYSITWLAWPFFYGLGWWRYYTAKDKPYMRQYRMGMYSNLSHNTVNNAERALRYNKRIIMHAVSLGEVKSLDNIIERLSKQPDTCVIIMVTTLSAWQYIQRYNDNDNIIILPTIFDHPLYAKRLFITLQPTLYIIIEAELWPNIIYMGHKYQCAIMRLNARMSQRSYKRARHVGSLWRYLDKYIAISYCQSEADKNRLMECGFTKLYYVGNIKYMNKPASIDNNSYRTWQKWLDGRSILVAASTHEGEEQLALDIFKQIQNIICDMLIIIPRHVERASYVGNMANHYGFGYNFSSQRTLDSKHEILIIDEWGKNSLWYKLSPMALIGGSWALDGGHNPMEALQQYCRVISGTGVENFADIYAQASHHNYVFLSHDTTAICNYITRFHTQLLPRNDIDNFCHMMAGGIDDIMQYINDSA